MTSRTTGLQWPDIRCGSGFDAHVFDPQRPLFLAGLEFPEEPGLKGHSDADVLAHALVDALLGAAGLGDIGRHFPPGDPQWAGAGGSSLLAATMIKVRTQGYELMNADLTLIGERPKIAPHRKVMAANLARALDAPPEAVNLKATTTEGLGFAGRREGLAALACVLLIGRRHPE